MRFPYFLMGFVVITVNAEPINLLDNGLSGEPLVDCMEDRVKLTFQTEKPFSGRIFVKGMIDNPNCVTKYPSNKNSSVQFQLQNGECNMRRSRKLGPEQRGVEQSIVVIVSFHDTFITKVDRAYRCTCFYMEADKVVTNRFDVSALPTTELVDTAKMPQCTYSVRRGSVNGPVVAYATIGEPVFHVWQCDSDTFSMLVHNCFVDDGAGRERKPILDENGCSIDPIIVSDLTYNNGANLAYSEVNVFKFADKVTTYFQCSITTCMISEGMCKGITPPRCGAAARKRRTVGENATRDERMTMDISAEKIVVLDLEDIQPREEGSELDVVVKPSALNGQRIEENVRQLNLLYQHKKVCFSQPAMALFGGLLAFLLFVGITSFVVFTMQLRKRGKI
ncbi:unnamed protein product [Bursaphelenchus xylophilus]|uniref:(pine wood nematode) hypothetical protein n=1 Tax=Bursaphelenchus xylophilus TaxID=6326 RepID=A0A1I7RY54_BURXY|nr:unnamed protein product [Bursaphelenchus xylophilus]CAG9085313.1 unnamed protein product [Bursaphelenchus xylophilus]